MIAIIDYGVGNLYSLSCAFKSIGAQITVTSNPEIIKESEKIVLPGVGAFEDAIAKLRQNGLDRLLIEQAKDGKDILGICLGMQMLFEKSMEYGEHKGLGLLKGSVVPMEGKLPNELKIPHIGWNKLNISRPCHLFKNVNEGDCVYFVHSYYAENCQDSVVATTEYGIDLTACVCKNNIMGCQFHPEKSGKVGQEILKAFCEGAKK